MVLSTTGARFLASSLRKATPHSSSFWRHLFGSTLTRIPRTAAAAPAGGVGTASGSRYATLSTTTKTHRHNSSSAAFSAYDDDEEHLVMDVDSSFMTTQTLSAVAVDDKQSATPVAVPAEDWRINLGRKNDNAWLSGPRPTDWWTGVYPTKCPGVDVSTGQLRSLPLPNLDRVTRQAAQEYFDNSWTLYETLFAGLKGEEGFYRPPPHGLRHPQIFYYGHTACLYVNKLRVAGVLEKPVNAYFESIFEVGVDEMLWDDLQKNDMLWPTVSEVHAYRQQVYETVSEAIWNHPSLGTSENGKDAAVRVDSSHPMWALFMGFEHERIHFETSSVLFRETPVHLMQTPPHWPAMHPSARQNTPTTRPVEGVDYPSNRMIPVAPTKQSHVVELGKPPDFPSFGWDNEYGSRTVDVPPFHAAAHMTSNGEYWQFVADGGYRTREYWCDDGWAWRAHRNRKWPFFWQAVGPAGSHEFKLRTIFENVSMPWSWPVDVNYYEAKAFCRWKTAKEGSPTSQPYRLLTEAEHHIIRHREHNLEAARNNVEADKVMSTSGQAFARGETGANLNLAYSSQNPVDAFLPSHTGHCDTTGNAWEWTEDHFNPLKGFEVHHVYDDFSTPCFDGKHSMIVGGSFISTGDEASVFARFHFRPHFLQHSGFRLVASDADAPATHLYAGNFEGQAAAREVSGSGSGDQEGAETKGNVYETEDSVHMYLSLHFPTSGDKENVSPILPHGNSPVHGLRFPQRVAQVLKSLNPEYNNNKALDIGCAVGGASFELARTFNQVDAFDFSQAFIENAKKMQYGEDVRFRVPIEAELYEEVQAVHEEGIDDMVCSKINFFTGDACQMKEMQAQGLLGKYDGAVISNLLCRLPDPMACLDALPSLLNEGGVIVMVTPFSWLTEFTPRSKWLGGFQDPVTKDAIFSKDVLKDVMESNGFEKIHEEEMPLIIREHRRKYQYIVSEATGWRRVA